MGKRDTERFDYSSLIDKGGVDPNELYVEIEFLDNLKGRIVDISLKGVGFKITGISEENSKILAKEKDYFLKIHAGDEFFLAGVKNRWYVVEEGLFQGGVEIEIISPEDSLRLNNLIAAFRRLSD